MKKNRNNKTYIMLIDEIRQRAIKTNDYELLEHINIYYNVHINEIRKQKLINLNDEL